MTTFTRTFTFDKAAWAAPTLEVNSKLEHITVEFELTSPGHYFINIGKLIDDLGWSDVIEKNHYSFDELVVRALERLTRYVDHRLLTDPSFAEEARVLTAQRQSIWVIDHVAVLWLSTAVGSLGYGTQLSVVEWLEGMLENLHAFD